MLAIQRTNGLVNGKCINVCATDKADPKNSVGSTLEAYAQTVRRSIYSYGKPRSQTSRSFWSEVVKHVFMQRSSMQAIKCQDPAHRFLAV